jgi:hypothetical protein
VFDNYYFSNAVLQLMREHGTKYIAACKSNTLNDLTRVVEGRLTRPGDHVGLYNEEHHELFLNVWDANQSIGKKYCFSNAFDYNEGPTPLASRHLVPAYDWYKAGFSICDKFNQGLSDHKFPYRAGGKNKPGEDGHQHKFAMLVVVENVLNATESLHPDQDHVWRDFCRDLSSNLYNHAVIFI